MARRNARLSAFVSVSARLRIEEVDHLSAGSAQTGADGTFVVVGLDRLLEPVLAVAADGAGCVRRVVRRPAVDEDEIDVGDVVLPAPSAIGGTVEDSSGTVLVRTRVVLRGPKAREGGGSNLGEGLEYRMTDDLGRFRFPDLSAGEFVLSTAVAGEPEVCTTVVVPPASDVGGVVLRAERTRAVVVRVVDDSGGPVSGAIVSVSTPAGLGGHAVAGKDGVARLATSERDLRISFLGTWGRLAGRSFLPVPALEVPAGGPTEVTLALRAGAAVSGTVLDPDGKPLPHVLVKAVHGSLPPSAAWTEPDGRFSVTVPAQGTVDLVVEGQSSIDGKSVDLLVEGLADAVASGTEGLVIRCARVEAGRTLVVRVTTPEGQPVAGVRVDARYSANPVPATATIGADGRAELAGLTSRAHVIHASGMGALLPPRSTGAAVVPAGQEVTLVLRRSATIRGVVVTEDGRPAPGVSVSVGADEESGSAAYGAKADDQGAFVLLVPEEARGAFTVQAFGLVGSAQVRGSVADVRAGDSNVRLVARK